MFLYYILFDAAIIVTLIMIENLYVEFSQGFRYALSNRLEVKKRGPFGDRLRRTIVNQMETMMYSLPVLVIAAITGASSSLAITAGASYLLGRFAFAAFYLAGVPFLRSLAWGISWMSVAVIAYEIFNTGAL